MRTLKTPPIPPTKLNKSGTPTAVGVRDTSATMPVTCVKTLRHGLVDATGAKIADERRPDSKYFRPEVALDPEEFKRSDLHRAFIFEFYLRTGC